MKKKTEASDDPGELLILQPGARMTSWLPSFGGMLRRSRSEAETLQGAARVRGGEGLITQQLSLELDSLPELEGESHILREEDIGRLGESLPARLIGASWRLVFSTEEHGFSLASVYRKFREETNPSLLVLQDTRGGVFGALSSCPLRESDNFYGTGESFLFTCRPSWRLYSWAGENQLFVRGTPHDLVVGAGEGQFGIWLDSSLYKGRTQACQTYRNEPLAIQGDFTVRALECWTFD